MEARGGEETGESRRALGLRTQLMKDSEGVEQCRQWPMGC
jgi:hypothetical protein